VATGFKTSGVDIYDIKTLSGVEVISDWEVIKEFDFTKASDHTFSDGVAESFGGVNWVCQNLSTYGGADSYIKFIEGTGLQIFITGSSAADSNFFCYNMSAPLLQAQVSDIATAAGVSFSGEDTLCYQVLLETPTFHNVGRTVSNPGGPYDGTTQDANNLQQRLVLSDGTYGTAGGALWCAAVPWLSSSITPHTASWSCRLGGATPLGGSDATPGAPVDDVQIGASSTKWPRCMEMVAAPAAGYLTSMAHTSSTGKTITNFPRPLTMTYRSSGTMSWQVQEGITNNPGVAPSYALLPSNSYVVMSANIVLWNGIPGSYGPGTPFYISAGITATFTKLRILRRVPNG
tara:strand:+ start:956 stop:1993 length:1038 start_codon:yes stop_codon:yes gene_type:complete